MSRCVVNFVDGGSSPAAMKNFIVVVGTVVIVVAVAATLIPLTDKDRIRNTDFVNFYAGASIVRDGNGARLYQRETQDQALESILSEKSTRYYLHPPFEAAALAPITRLGIEGAFVSWTLLNVALLGLLPLVLMHCIPLVSRRPYLGWIGFCFLPALTALTLGQDSILLLFVISLSYMLLQKEMDLASGLLLALALIKFQYLVILVPLLLLSRRVRVVTGFVLGAIGLALVSCMVTGWRGLLEYFRFLHDFDIHSGYGALNTALMVNFRGFLRGMGWASGSPVYLLVAGAILFCVGIACSRIPAQGNKNGLIFAVYIAIALLAAPYAHFPDMTVLLLSVLLALDWVADAGRETVWRILIAVCCALLFVWPVMLLILHGHYWWNSRIYLVFPLGVAFVATMAGALLWSDDSRRTSAVAG
jgi:hypothetical protein